MSVTDIELKVSEEIASGADVCDTYTPANGAEVWIELFHANAAFTTNSAVLLLWDYDTVDEVVVWSSKGSESFNQQMQITGADGTKKLALCCSNGEAGALILSGFCKVKVIT